MQHRSALEVRDVRGIAATRFIAGWQHNSDTMIECNLGWWSNARCASTTNSAFAPLIRDTRCTSAQAVVGFTASSAIAVSESEQAATLMSTPPTVRADGLSCW